MQSAESIFALFNDLVAQGKTIIIVTHDGGLAKHTHRIALIAGEVADVLKIPTDTVKSRLARARNRISEKLCSVENRQFCLYDPA